MMDGREAKILLDILNTGRTIQYGIDPSIIDNHYNDIRL